MPFLPSNQQCQSTEGYFTVHGTAHKLKFVFNQPTYPELLEAGPGHEKAQLWVQLDYVLYILQALPVDQSARSSVFTLVQWHQNQDRRL